MPDLTIPIRRRGALLKVLLRPGPSLPIAGPLTAYLDTGASDTMLDSGVVASLGLEPTRDAALNVLGREDVSFHQTFDVEIALALPDLPPRWLPLTVLGGTVFSTGAVAALGRDFLAHFFLTYHGPRRRATLCW